MMPVTAPAALASPMIGLNLVWRGLSEHKTERKDQLGGLGKIGWSVCLILQRTLFQTIGESIQKELHDLGWTQGWTAFFYNAIHSRVSSRMSHELFSLVVVCGPLKRWDICYIILQAIDPSAQSSELRAILLYMVFLI